MSDRLLTAEQVAERFQVPTSHVYRLTRSGRLESIELGRYRRYSEEALRQFLEAGGTRQSDPTPTRSMNR